MFDIGASEITDSFAPIPVGLYNSFVDSVEFKMSKAGAEYLSVCFKLFGEHYANRVVFNIYNVFHQKDQVKNIAMGDLKKMFLASGITEDKMKFKNKEELLTAVLSVRCMIKLGIQKNEEYGDKNIIKGYRELDDKANASAVFSTDDIPF